MHSSKMMFEDVERGVDPLAVPRAKPVDANPMASTDIPPPEWYEGTNVVEMDVVKGEAAEPATPAPPAADVEPAPTSATPNLDQVLAWQREREQGKPTDQVEGEEDPGPGHVEITYEDDPATEIEL